VATNTKPFEVEEKFEVQLVRKQNEIRTSRPARKRNFILMLLPVIGWIRLSSGGQSELYVVLEYSIMYQESAGRANSQHDWSDEAPTKLSVISIR
jgi:hypothetical protein